MGSIFSELFNNWVNAFEQEEGKKKQIYLPNAKENYRETAKSVSYTHLGLLALESACTYLQSTPIASQSAFMALAYPEHCASPDTNAPQAVFA